MAIKICNLLRVGSRSFWGSGRPREPRRLFQKAGGEAPHPFKGPPGPPGPTRPPNDRFPILNKLKIISQSTAKFERTRIRSQTARAEGRADLVPDCGPFTPAQRPKPTQTLAPEARPGDRKHYSATCYVLVWFYDVCPSILAAHWRMCNHDLEFGTFTWTP